MPLASGDSSHQIAFHTSVRNSVRCARACVCMCITQSSNDFEMYIYMKAYVVRGLFSYIGDNLQPSKKTDGVLCEAEPDEDGGGAADAETSVEQCVKCL